MEKENNEQITSKNMINKRRLKLISKIMMMRWKKNIMLMMQKENNVDDDSYD